MSREVQTKTIMREVTRNVFTRDATDLENSHSEHYNPSMQSREALRALAEVSASQWGMVTSAQARARDVSHMNLTRLFESEDLVRLSHGVYKIAGAPGGQFEDLRAAWLATEPSKLAHDRLGERPPSAVVSGESAARLHGIGDLRAMKSEFTTTTRKQTQRADVRYRTRALPGQDITVREGLPTTTRERTIADLVEDRHDLSIVGNALRDAARQTLLDVGRLTELLSPLAERYGHRKDAGAALLEGLMRIAGIDQESIAKQIASIPSLASLVATQYLEDSGKISTSESDNVPSAALEASGLAQIEEQLQAADSVSIARALQPK